MTTPYTPHFVREGTAIGRVLVTGASGFIGRAAVPLLRQRGFDVHAVARNAADEVAADAWHEADVLETRRMSGLVRQVAPTHLVHLAWSTVHGRFWRDPSNMAWTEATCALMESFASAGGTRAVMAGSCAQYDWHDVAISGVADEARTPRRPASLYGVAKQSTTALLEAWAAEIGLSYATGLVFFPYGRFEKPDRLVASVTRRLLSGEVAHVAASAHVRDFIHVHDCAAAIAALVDSEVTGSVNIGSGRGTSVGDVGRLIAAVVGRRDLLVLEHTVAEDPSTVVAAVKRLREDLRFVPTYDIEAGLRDTIEWWRERLFTERGAGNRRAMR